MADDTSKTETKGINIQLDKTFKKGLKIGKKDYLKDVNKNLPKKIKTKFIFKKNSPTIVKKRFVDSINQTKVIGIYNINDEILNKTDENLFNKLLLKEIKKHDLIIVSDYGHGLISNKSADLICRRSKYLALNAQVNAANIGYHSMRKYKKVDCVIINDRELRHELRDKNRNIEYQVVNSYQKYDPYNFIKIHQFVTAS